MSTYTVRAGDTLAMIAQAYAVTVEDLLAANAITDPNLVYAGQTLRIPVDPAVTPVWPTATPTPIEPTPTPTVKSAVGVGRWIDVDLSKQTVTAYEDGTPVRTTLASTGLPQTPTPVGQFRVWIKLRTDDMSGPDYYIEDVPFVMYFHGGYGLHGVTWHANFGHPMSHGCVNLPTEEAAWLFDWAEVGTLVNIHE
jgi:lipoprotein-anchoring transpeptidase ErfK/SrfK